ncbi:MULTISPECIES: helix-turn-helix transcriptional regulator [Bacillus]|uniref:helix-turn-helix transcriptional regulator n=1 Tax=Bacillus TaxID=1386 RepID=UPI0009929AF5|nr:helix-turn-helix transcriptional regulator [Bacillus pseudomycoides]MED4714261.1 helix-turn-helix transcriptional regulator [Bacillus pseudomycoides]OOR48872.1 transcriptional regulator [Bacillus pseudomycoides]
MLYRERVNKSLSLEKLSQKLHIKPQVLHAIEKGKSGVNAERAEKISAIFNQPVEYIFVPTYYRVRA